MGEIVVLGSFVVDLTSKTPHLPNRGETVFGGPFKLGPGGKGSNQGVAAKRSGSDVTMITKLGKDEFAEIALNNFKKENMVTDFVFQSEKHETGAALILVEDKTAENEIVVSIGACNYIKDSEIYQVEEKIKDSDLFLTQLETNLSAVVTGINIAKKHGIKVVLNTAPVQKLDEKIYQYVDIVTPNEVEASILSDVEVKDVSGAKKAAAYFRSRGVETVIITMGKKGAFIKNDKVEKLVSAFQIDKVVDTTGAGDAFNGGLVTALAEGKEIEEAVVFANAVGALSVTKFGTAPAMPFRDEIDKFLQTNKL
ncbi:ribokinase [Halocella sp. SP3-1]|uniref:ribokinase n=1 Tax=Halocella sp. SP3-1 TaxID=2382161 RepID=UPI000F755D2A|nr:ribokinase [Halocella sp. SP3-1]AZO93867.1 ribokinase [Halocella sp. SP3-1]